MIGCLLKKSLTPTAASIDFDDPVWFIRQAWQPGSLPFDLLAPQILQNLFALAV